MYQPMTVPAAYRVGWREWLALPETHLFCEILDGEVHMSPAPSVLHQTVAGELFARLREHVRSGDLGRVFIAPLGVRLSEEDVVEPDVVVVLRPHLSRIAEAGLLGAPDLVVEVLSPGTAGRDLGIKRRLYERYGVPEYWIADPHARVVEVLSLTGTGYKQAGLFRREDALTSPLLPGLEIPLGEVFPAE